MAASTLLIELNIISTKFPPPNLDRLPDGNINVCFVITTAIAIKRNAHTTFVIADAHRAKNTSEAKDHGQFLGAIPAALSSSA